MIISELKSSQETLERILENSRIQRGSLVVNDESILFELPLDTTFYDDIEAESLGKTLNMNELSKTQKIYRKIIRFNRRYRRFIGGATFEPEFVESLKKEIIEVIDLFEDCQKVK